MLNFGCSLRFGLEVSCTVEELLCVGCWILVEVAVVSVEGVSSVDVWF